MQTFHSSSRRAFTLVEMLIVIFVIALLAALIFPALSRAREGARTKVCLSNMKQLGLGFQQYVQDNGRRYPLAGIYQRWNRGAHWVSGDSVCPSIPCPDGGLALDGAPYTYQTGRVAKPEAGALFPYTKSAQVYICPSTEDSRQKLLSYSMNCAMSGLHDVRIQSPSDMVLLVDEGKSLNDGFFYATKNSESKAPGNSTDELTQVHNGGGNLLFADGHVKFISFNKFTLDGSGPGQDNKWAGAPGTIEPPAGTPRFHDKRFGYLGSNTLNPLIPDTNGTSYDSCWAPPPPPPPPPTP